MNQLFHQLNITKKLADFKTQTFTFGSASQAELSERNLLITLNSER